MQSSDTRIINVLEHFEWLLFVGNVSDMSNRILQARVVPQVPTMYWELNKGDGIVWRLYVCSHASRQARWKIVFVILLSQSFCHF